MKITRTQLKNLIKEEMTRTDESSYHFSNNDWEQESAGLLTNLIMSGIESLLGQMGKEDSDEYATDVMSVIKRFGNQQFLKGINDIYREIERAGVAPPPASADLDGDDSWGDDWNDEGTDLRDDYEGP